MYTLSSQPRAGNPAIRTQQRASTRLELLPSTQKVKSQALPTLNSSMMDERSSSGLLGESVDFDGHEGMWGSKPSPGNGFNPGHHYLIDPQKPKELWDDLELQVPGLQLP